MSDNSNHISGVEMIRVVNRLKSGESVICLSCKEGFYKPVNDSNFKTTHCFQCEHCSEMINID